MDETVKDILYVLCRMHQGADGIAQQLMNIVTHAESTRPNQARQERRRQIAAACEATPEEVESWEQGDAFPNPRQALTWMRCLHDDAATIRKSPSGARYRSPSR